MSSGRFEVRRWGAAPARRGAAPRGRARVALRATAPRHGRSWEVRRPRRLWERGGAPPKRGTSPHDHRHSRQTPMVFAPVARELNRATMPPYANIRLFCLESKSAGDPFSDVCFSASVAKRFSFDRFVAHLRRARNPTL